MCADLRTGCANHGLAALPYLAFGYLAGIASVPGDGYETRLGLCVAIADGGGNLCYNPHRVRSWPAFAFRPRTQRDGAGNCNNVSHCGYRSARRQNPILAMGTLPPS